MPRKAAPFLIAALALPILAALGWFKWNERGSEASLRADLERQVRANISGHFADCDLSGLTVRNLKFEPRASSKDAYWFKAQVVVLRRRFATEGSHSPTKNYFEPSGTGVYEMRGFAEMGRETVAAFPFLGPVRPVWSRSVPFVSLPPDDRPEMERIVVGGASALFDAHFEDNQLFKYSYPDLERHRLRLLARPTLRQTGRLVEAAELWIQDWMSTTPFRIKEEPDRLKEATTLLHALERAGPDHEHSIAQMGMVLD